MSNTVKDGGTAFPLATSEYGGNGPELGMSLRDYFAAKAIEGACNGVGGLPDGLFCEAAAKRAYQMADAMLKARETSSEPAPRPSTTAQANAPIASYCQPVCAEEDHEYWTEIDKAIKGAYTCRKCGLEMPF